MQRSARSRGAAARAAGDGRLERGPPRELPAEPPHLAHEQLEVGVGPNTPIVTRIPACAFASAVQANGGRAVYVRLNPDAPEGSRHNPADGVAFWRIRQTWRALEPLVQAVLPRDPADVAVVRTARQQAREAGGRLRRW